MEDNIVIVVDTANYKASYSEPVPFKARVVEDLGNEVWVRSVTTDKMYELYPTQILERLDIEEIAKLIDLSKYGT